MPAYLYRGLSYQHLGQIDVAIQDFTHAAGLKETASDDRAFALNSATDLLMQTGQ